MNKADAALLADETFDAVKWDLNEQDPECATSCMDESVLLLLDFGYYSIAWRLIDDVKLELNKYWSVQFGTD